MEARWNGWLIEAAAAHLLKPKPLNRRRPVKLKICSLIHVYSPNVATHNFSVFLDHLLSGHWRALRWWHQVPQIQRQPLSSRRRQQGDRARTVQLQGGRAERDGDLLGLRSGDATLPGWMSLGSCGLKYEMMTSALLTCSVFSRVKNWGTDRLNDVWRLKTRCC